MSVMAISVIDGTHMVSLQLLVLPKLSGTLGILCSRLDILIVQRVGLLATSLSFVVISIPTFLIPSLPLLVIEGRLLREVMMCVELSCRSKRSRGQSQRWLHRWCVID